MKVQQATHRQHGIQGCRHRSPHHRSSVHGYASGLRNPFPKQAPKNPSCAIIWCRSTDSHLDVSTDNRATGTLVCWQCPCGSAVSTEVTDHIGRRFAYLAALSSQPLAVLPSQLPFHLLAASSSRVPAVRALP